MIAYRRLGSGFGCLCLAITGTVLVFETYGNYMSNRQINSVTAIIFRQ